uniref:Predicted protein n=1 Tax=Hordeum vulgare subsp. vulgare TaxID=112509 RepID=F2EBK4_HORVV|nr:predicted protein [Hordeum vulgare subsp. vulgare]
MQAWVRGSAAAKNLSLTHTRQMRETDGPVKSTASSAAPVCFPSSLLQGIFCWCHGDRGPGQDHTGAKTNGMCAVPRENVHLDKIWQPFECQCDF